MTVGEVITVNGKPHTVTEADVKDAARNFREMCAARQAPGVVRTEQSYQHAGNGHATLADQYKTCPSVLKRLLRTAKRKYGFTPSASMHYNGTITNEFGHPDNFISAAGGISEVRAKVKKHGWDVLPGISDDGSMLRLKRREPKPPKPAKAMSDMEVKNVTRMMVRENPDLAHVSKAELKRMAIEKHGAKK